MPKLDDYSKIEPQISGWLSLKLLYNSEKQIEDALVLDCNPSFLEYSRFSRETLLNHSILTLSKNPKASFAKWMDALYTNLILSPKPVFEYIDHKHNRSFSIVKSLVNQEFCHLYVIETFKDDAFKMRNELKQSADNFTNFFNTISDMLFILDSSGNMIEVNETVRKRLGYTNQEMLGHTVLMVHPEERRDEAALNVAQMLRGEIEFCPIPVISKYNQSIPVETRVCPGIWNGKPVLFGVSKDISELKASEEKFSKAFNNSATIMAISKVDGGVYIDINQAFTNILGYKRSDVLGKSSADLNLFVDKAQRESIRDIMLSKKKLDKIEIKVKTKDGAIKIGLFSVENIYLGDEACFMTTMVDLTERIEMERVVKQYNEQLEGMVAKKVREISEAQITTIIALSKLTESRDANTANHLERIRDACRIVTQRLVLNQSYIEVINSDFILNIQIACPLHDIGKVGIRDKILLKPGKLNEEENKEMRKHPLIGGAILQEVNAQYSENKFIKMGMEIAYSHHEKWDGSGYPNGLKGDQIPLSAQIVAICDVYDALRSKRSYKKAYEHIKSMDIIINDNGEFFNPIIVKAFIECETAIKGLYDDY
ncbi:MAG: PAS domain S-box protein, partial [Erysipelotrichaceae bacterium]